MFKAKFFWLCFLLARVLVGNESLNIATKAPFATKQRHFVVVVPTYNNDRYFQRNFDSIINQDYENYEVIIIDDASTDNTYANLHQVIEAGNFQNKVTLMRNEVNRGALHNIYSMIQKCKNESIVVLCDGDDWLGHLEVLKDLNLYYENEDVWVTYGQFTRYPSGRKGQCTPVSRAFLQSGRFRMQQGWVYSHLRTFYAGLAKRIKLIDLLLGQSFYRVGGDLPLMYPILEMSRTHTYFTPDISYVYNQENPLNDYKLRLKEQENVEKVVRKKPIYPELKEHPSAPLEGSLGDMCDLVVFSYNRPMQLYSLLESVKERVSGLRKTFVIYRQDPGYERGYEIVKAAFTDATFLKQSEVPNADFKPLLLQATFLEKGADFILFAVDDIIVTDTIDVQEGIAALKSTGAYGFYYRLGRGIDTCYTLNFFQGTPPLLEINTDCLAWKFGWGKGDWRYSNSVDFVLYRKREIENILKRLEFANPNALEGNWSRVANMNRLGLCAERAKIVNIPMNKVTTFQNRHANFMSPEAMNREFEKGYKIDITPLFQLDHNSVHTEIIPKLIPRIDLIIDN